MAVAGWMLLPDERVRRNDVESVEVIGAYWPQFEQLASEGGLTIH